MLVGIYLISNRFFKNHFIISCEILKKIHFNTFNKFLFVFKTLITYAGVGNC